MTTLRRRLARLIGSAALVALVASPTYAESDSDPGVGSAAVADAVEEAAADAASPQERRTPLERAQAQAPVDRETLQEAINLYQRRDVAEGDRVRAGIRDRSAHALLEWIAIRSGAPLGFERTVAFLREHPGWPAAALVRRRAEEQLLSDRKPAALVRTFFATERPVSASGKLALALAFRAEDLDRDAADLIRDAWRNDTFGRQLEERILETFPGVLTRADHRFRMERLLFKERWADAERAAARAGAGYVSLAKARHAVEKRAKNAPALLDAVPASLRSDTSYVFARAQHLRRQEKADEAAKVIADVSRDANILVDGDAWWTERRLIARQLLDDGEAKAAYAVVLPHAAESNATRIEAEFHAGWIALRFLGDSKAAAEHFATADAVAATPISVSRTAYWRGRAAESAGAQEEARRQFERAAHYPITYYGQLARGRLGHSSLVLRTGADTGEARAALDGLSPVRGIRLLYQAGETELGIALFAALAQRLDDAAELDALGDLAVEFRDPRALLVVGKTAVQRGFPLDRHAYPTMGIPSFEVVGDSVEKAMVYAIARQESAFNPEAVSSAGARGLMQLMPATARRTAQRFKVGYDLKRLTADPAYNAKLGSAHLGELMDDWRGSFILTFASYNAGGPNVKKWIDAYGDPRSPGVDPVDWVERIPFSETRNYVQRVLENLQVYRQRLGERSALILEQDLRHSAAAR